MSLYSDIPLQSPGSFRLLRLLPGEAGDVIRLELSYSLLQEKPEYEALSYEWGKSGDDHLIFCNHFGLRVNSGLAAALERLRLPDRPRCIWIDRICIDQENVQERNEQVTMMRDIYARAKLVLIWLGKEMRYTKDAFQMIPNLARRFVARQVNEALTGDRMPYIQTLDDIPDKEGLQLENDLLWQAIFDLFSRTYFRRTWIVQEIVVASRARVFCGSQEADWMRFHWAASYVTTTTYLLHQMSSIKSIVLISAISEIQARFKQTQADCLLDILFLCQGSSATDPRDKVYGLLGLHNRHERNFHKTKIPMIDYRKRPSQIYQEVAKYMISVDQDLRIFQGQTLTAKLVCGMPSWVPDWSTRAEGAPAAFLVVHYKLHLYIKPSLRFRRGSLFVRGVMVDKIDHVIGIMSCENPFPHLKDIILRLSQSQSITGAHDTSVQVNDFDLLLGAWEVLSSRTYRTSQSFQEALWRTLIGNVANLELARSSFQQHFHAVVAIMLLRERGVVFEHIRESVEIEMDEASKEILNDDEIAQYLWDYAYKCNGQPYFAELVNTIHGRVFFTTSQGYMGFAAPGTKPGDHVSILGGGWTPFVLRESPGRFYTMLGESYVHGLMDGESLKVSGAKFGKIEIR